MEDPSYFLAHQILRDHHVKLEPMRQHSDGSGTLDVEHVAKHLSGLKASGGQMPKLLYCVPTGNNPTGNSMPDSDRARLVRLCAAHQIHLVADDVYELLQWAMDVAPKPMRWHAAQQGVGWCVISLGSWSKLLGPGLRLGWIEWEAELLKLLAKDGETDSGSLTSPLVECLVTDMIVSGRASTHVDALRNDLCARATLLARTINDAVRGVPPIVNVAPAGYFLWVDLVGLDADELRERCAASWGVTFLPGNRCALDTAAGASRARVSFAFLEEADLVEAGRRLGKAISEARAEALVTAPASARSKRKASELADDVY